MDNQWPSKDLPRDQWIDFIVRWKFDVTGTNGCVIVYRHDNDWPGAVQVFNYAGRSFSGGLASETADVKDPFYF